MEPINVSGTSTWAVNPGGVGCGSCGAKWVYSTGTVAGGFDMRMLSGNGIANKSGAEELFGRFWCSIWDLPGAGNMYMDEDAVDWLVGAPLAVDGIIGISAL
jgi:hypothetical protein